MMPIFIILQQKMAATNMKTLMVLVVFMFIVGNGNVHSVSIKKRLSLSIPVSPAIRKHQLVKTREHCMLEIRGGGLVPRSTIQMISAFFKSLFDPTFMMTHNVGNQGSRNPANKNTGI
jgi:hypothetical protein